MEITEAFIQHGGNIMDFMDISKKRQTVRKFAQKPVEAEKIQKILEAGRWSPTAVNGQPQRILVLNTPESLAKVREFCAFGYDRKYVDLAKECDDQEHGKINLYYGAPLVLLVCYDKAACWTHPQSGKSSGATDATIVATHMMLEAASLDLGSVWISYFDEDKARQLLHLPQNWQSVCMLYLGYPADDFVPNTHLGGHRKPLSETCFYNEVPTDLKQN
jgi:nitroreductase